MHDAVRTAELEARFQNRKSKRLRSNSTAILLIQICAYVVALGVLAILSTIVVKGAPAINWTFLTAPPTDGMTKGGIGPMIQGTLLLMFGTLMVALPVGVLGGVFLAEYAGRGRWVQVTRSLITSLAGTPSIIYGLFGLAVFVLWFKQLGWTQGSSLLAGCLTLGLMAAPIIILSTESAMRSVPNALIDGGLALGMTRWQVVAKIALPYAVPGIMTGIVVTVGRVAGEAPPILLTAGIYYTSQQQGLSKNTLFEPVMNLSYHLAEGYRQGTTIPETIVWGTCLVLMITILCMTFGAIAIRSKARAKQRA